jgi:hypothetical protein
MSKKKTVGLRRSKMMLIFAVVAEILKRMGLGKQLIRLNMRQMRSEKLKRKAFKGYQPTEHDVFVTTFAKSGTNWMMQIAQQICHRGDAEFEHIHTVAPWPETPALGAIPLRDPGPLDASPTGLRIIKTHLETDFVPYDEKATYLTILRDPKEVLVSAYYFIGGILGLLNHVTIDEWYELAISPGGLIESWSTHAASFWEWRDRPNVLVLNFREVKSEPRRSIERVAAIMGVKLTEAQLSKVIERASLDYMKAHESQFGPPQSPFGDKSKPTLMIRRGVSGQSQELLSKAQQEEIDRLCQAQLREIGSDFPYVSEFESSSLG